MSDSGDVVIGFDARRLAREGADEHQLMLERRQRLGARADLQVETLTQQVDYGVTRPLFDAVLDAMKADIRRALLMPPALCKQSVLPGLLILGRRPDELL
ncbi:MAG TPA: hypothetical protein VGG29_20835 [Caulobacteraceae bacterium]|jgi:hypothetical protein